MIPSEHYLDTGLIQSEIEACLDEGGTLEQYARALVMGADGDGVELFYEDCLAFTRQQLNRLPNRMISLRVPRASLLCIDAASKKCGQGRSEYMVRRAIESDTGIVQEIQKLLNRINYESNG